MDVRQFILIILVCLSFNDLTCLATQLSIAEQLGYHSEAKLLIIHADDLGLADAVNQAAFHAFETGSISSASVMVPTKKFYDVVSFSKNNPQYDIGLHLTLNSEWKNEPWGGVSDSTKISTILTKKKHFYSSPRLTMLHADINDIQHECQAQIDKARQAGLNLSHLDVHMGVLFYRKDFINMYIELGRKNKIPIFLPKYFQRIKPMIKDNAYVVWVDETVIISTSKINKNKWKDFYLKKLKQLKPGLSVLLIHPGKNNKELQDITSNSKRFGAKWRQLDTEVVSSYEFKDELNKQNIHVISYKDIQKLLDLESNDGFERVGNPNK